MNLLKNSKSWNEYQNNLGTLMRVADFISDYVDLMYYKCQNKPELCWIIYIFSSLDKNQESNNRSCQ